MSLEAVTAAAQAYGEARYQQGLIDGKPVPPPEPPPEEKPTTEHTLVLAEDFADLSGWSNPYNGSKAYAIQGARLKENVEVRNGVLTVHCRPVTVKTVIDGKTLNPGDYAAGGIMHKGVLHPRGHMTLDLRMKASKGTRAVALLWPEGPWPEYGELDFIENGADIPDRQSTAITNHWAGADGKNAQKVIKYGPYDFTTWSPVEVEWLPDHFLITVDGVEAARYVDHMPPGPMHLGIQTAVAGGGQDPSFKGTPRTAGHIQVRNVRFYRH